MAQHLSVTISAVRGANIAELVEAFGGESRAGKMTLDQADTDGTNLVRFAQSEGWGWTVEHFTTLASDPAVLSRASLSGPAVALSCTQTINTLVYATDGSLQSGFDLLAPAFRFGAAPDRLEQDLPGAESVTSRGSLQPSDALELIAILTGFEVSAAFLEGPLDTFTV